MYMLIFYRHCGVRNPSWAELNNFVKFLNIQLYDCEESVYCNEAIPVVRDVLQGFKQFVVKFMIGMSRVCCKDDMYYKPKNVLPIGFCNSLIKSCSNTSR